MTSNALTERWTEKEHKARPYLKRALYANATLCATFQWGLLLRKLSRSCFPKLSTTTTTIKTDASAILNQRRFLGRMCAAGDSQSKHWEKRYTHIHLVELFLSVLHVTVRDGSKWVQVRRTAWLDTQVAVAHMFVTFPSSFRLSENLQLLNENRLAKHTKFICDKMGN